MRRIMTALVLVGLAVPFGALAVVRAGGGAAKVRIGTYDNRAIAIAYAGSSYFSVSDKKEELRQAREAGDQKRVQELDDWGRKLQRRMHRQGFCRVPVDDLLAHVKDQIPALAAKLGLDAITWECDYCGPNVEVVDVTDELVRLFHPSMQSLEWASQTKDHKPIDLDDLKDDD